MGQLSHDTIISEALLKAGKEPSTLSTRATVWLNARLRGLYKGWAWPYLQRRIDSLALTTGTASLSLGAGAGGVTEEIKLIRSPILVYKSDYTVRVYAHIEELQGDFGDAGYDTTAQRGVPNRFKVRADTSLWGKWTLRPIPVPDRDLLLVVDYQIQPANISGSTVPLYPNDRTLIAGVMADAFIYMYGPDSAEAAAAEDEFSALAARDRAEYGGVPGTNDLLGLDSSVFR